MTDKTFYVLEADGTTSRDFDNFKEALAHALWLAERQAGDDVEVSTFVNGGDPETSDDWEAGAGPADDSCERWPHVYRREPLPPPPPRHAERCAYHAGGDCTCGAIAWDGGDDTDDEADDTDDEADDTDDEADDEADEAVTYTANIEGVEHDLDAETLDDAIDEAKDLARDWFSADEVGRETAFVEWSVDSSDGNEHDSGTITIEPCEPECPADGSGGEHDWHEDMLQAHGGGAWSIDHCRACGLIRKSDSWGTNPNNGSQGWDTVEYSDGTEAE